MKNETINDTILKHIRHTITKAKPPTATIEWNNTLWRGKPTATTATIRNTVNNQDYHTLITFHEDDTIIVRIYAKTMKRYHNGPHFTTTATDEHTIDLSEPDSIETMTTILITIVQRHQ